MAAAIAPQRYDAVIFDLDGVVTRTARVHCAAWKRLFDEVLAAWATRRGEPFRPFGDDDYRRWVDGKPRLNGIVDFLAARGIALPLGVPGEGPQAETAEGLGVRKDAYFHDHLRRHGVEVYPSSVRFVRACRAGGLRTAVVSSSRNARTVLKAAGAAPLFDVVVDGTDAAAHGLSGKPDPALFVEAARRLGCVPERCVVIEDAIAGVQAARRGGFGLVVGVDRAGQAAALRAAGVDLVLADLAELSVEAPASVRGPP